MIDSLLLFQQMFTVPALLFGLVLFAAGMFSAYRAPAHLRPYGPAAVLVYVGLASLMFAGGPAGLLVLALGLAWLLLAAVTQTLEALDLLR